MILKWTIMKDAVSEIPHFVRDGSYITKEVVQSLAALGMTGQCVFDSMIDRIVIVLTNRKVYPYTSNSFKQSHRRCHPERSEGFGTLHKRLFEYEWTS